MSEPRSDGRDQLALDAEAYEDALQPGSTINADFETDHPGIAKTVRMLNAVFHPDSRLTPSQSHQPAPQLSQIGRFKVERCLGSGNFGSVWLGHDPLLKRDVAVKVAHVGLHVRADLQERFQREAHLAARLHHPNIVQVFETDVDDGRLFIVSEYCAGQNLAEWLADRDEPVGPVVAAELVRQLADAADHAHRQGLIHRDIKPANVLLTREAVDSNEDDDASAMVPRLTDFGLARDLTSETSATRTGVLMGTAEYMSPEQASGNVKAQGAATDIYSLGVLLYRLLTGKTPFSGQADFEIIRQITTAEPVSPTRHRATIPRDLSSICLKCLEKSQARRYSSAAALRDDVDRFLRGEPTAARPITTVERIARWSKRAPAAATLVFVSLVSLTTIILGMGIYLRQVGQHSAELATALQDTLKEREVARQARDRTEDLLYAADVRLAAQALENANARHARELLSRHDPGDGDIDRRTFAWHYLWALLHKEEAILTMPDGDSANAVAYSPDGRFIVTGHGDGHLRVWDAPSKKLARTLLGHSVSIQSIQFSDDRCLSLDEEGTIAVWDLESIRPLQQQLKPDKNFAWGRIAPRANQLITGNEDGLIKLWNLDSDSSRVIGRHRDVRCFAFSPDGKWIVSAGQSSSIRLWNRATNALEYDQFVHSRFSQHNGRNHRLDVVAFSPDSETFAVGSNTGQIFVWDTQTRTEVANFPDHTSNIYDLTFSPDGRQLASTSKDSTVRIWTLGGEQPPGIIQGHGRPVYAACYSPDGRRFATSGKDGTVRVWNRLSETYSESNLVTILAWNGRLFSSCRSLAATNVGSQSFVHELGGDTRQLSNTLAGVPGIALANDRFVGFSCIRVIALDQARAPSNDTQSFVSTDLDGDGDVDTMSAFGSWGHLIWQENDGNPTLRPPRLYSQEADYRWIGRYQFVRWNSESRSTVLRCEPDLSRLTISPAPVGLPKQQAFGFSLLRDLGTPTSVWPCDVDRDGDQDLIITNCDDSRLEWFETDETWSFKNRHLITDDVPSAYGVITGDIRSDGADDVILLTTEGALLVLDASRSNNKCTFADPRTITTGLRVPSLLDVRDVDHDGQLDVVCASHDDVVWFRNVDGALTAPPRILSEFDSSWTHEPPSNVLVWDLETQRPVTHFNAHSQAIHGLSLSPDGRTVVTSDRDHSIIRFWRATDGKLLDQLPPVVDGGYVRTLEFSPDGQTVLFAAGDNGYVWDVKARELRHKLVGHDNTIERISVSDNGQYAATTSHDYSVRVWDIRSGQEVYVLIGHSEQPWLSRFSPDGRTLATAGQEGEVVLWDLITGQQLVTLSDFHCSRPTDIGFRDERTFVAVGTTREQGEYRGTRIGIWRTEGEEN